MHMLGRTFKFSMKYIISINPTQVSRGVVYSSRQWSLWGQLVSWFVVTSFGSSECKITSITKKGWMSTVIVQVP